MKKLILIFAVVGLVIVACQDNTDEVNPNQEITDIDMSDFYVYTGDDDLSSKASANAKKEERCHTMKVLNRQLRESPGLYNKMYAIEKHTRQFIAAKKPPGTPGGGNGNGNGNGNGDGDGDDPDPAPTVTISIPVMINIIEKYDGQVTLDQITSQIDILNEDFNDNNPFTDGVLPDYLPVPAEFASLVADVDITFVLDSIIRRISSKTNWSTDNSMKYTSQGGIDVTDPAHNLNPIGCK